MTSSTMAYKSYRVSVKGKPGVPFLSKGNKARAEEQKPDLILP